MKRKYLFNDFSTWTLIFSNLLTIFLALKEDWNLSTIIWIYWCQSVIIGFFNFIRILSLKEVSTEGFRIEFFIMEIPLRPNFFTQIFVAFFFAFHYGMFHFVYSDILRRGVFIRGLELTPPEINNILFTAIIFLINHSFSFLYNRKKDIKKQNIGRIMIFPYARIIPMHGVAIFGASLGGATIVLFLFLKTIADVIMHVVEHLEPKSSNKQ